jgi:RsiW-degrading membrane proteinase PrsW (M82 family)
MDTGLWEQMKAFLESWFSYPGLETKLLLIAIGLAIAFGIIWLAFHWPPALRRGWLWVVALAGAFLTLLAVTFVQIPLQYYISKVLNHYWDQSTLFKWLLLAGIPSVLVSGLVQEGSKMVPMVGWWWRSGKKIDPKTGLAIGAMAGFGFGVFEAFWVHSNVLAAGWTFDAVSVYGFAGISPFWERFFTVSFHIAVSSLVGYGLATGRGWQFFLIGSLLHGLLNYGALIYQKGTFNVNQIESYVAVVAVLTTAVVLWLRWKKDKATEPEQPAAPTEVPLPPTTEEPGGGV